MNTLSGRQNYRTSCSANTMVPLHIQRPEWLLLRIYLILMLLINFSSRSVSQNQNISNGNVFDGEPFIALNPINPQNIVVCWMGFVFGNGNGLTIRMRSTFDGGQTWSPTVNMPHMAPTHTSADPSMAFNDDGKLYISYIDYRKNPDSGGVYIAHSYDGGLNWSSPVKAIDAYADGSKIPVDRPWMVTNKGGDQLFLTTKPAPWVLPPNRPYFLSSSDSGLSWSSWRYIDSTGYLVGASIAAPMATPSVSANGIFYTVYPSYLPAQSLFPRFLMASTNTLGVVMNYLPVLNITAAVVNDSAKLSYLLLSDPVDSSHLVFIYPLADFGDIDISMTESMDAGSSWSVPVRLNDDSVGNGKLQDMLWGAFDTNGNLLISWRDRRNAPGTGFSVASEYYAIYRDHDSSNFSGNFLLSDSLVPFNAILAQDGNDFMSVVLSNDTVSAVWANTRDGSLDVWFSRISAKTGSVTGVSLLASESSDIAISPNPNAGVFEVKSLNEVMKSVTVFNEKGQLVWENAIQEKGCIINLSHQKRGVYLIRIETAKGYFTQKFIFQ